MCSRTTRMRFRKGSKVEVFGKREVPSGSWYSAEIIHGNGHYYTIKYDMEDLFERVPRKAIRPFPPLLQALEDWVSGDVVEVFHGFSWKMATVLTVMPKNSLFVRFVGSSQELEVRKSDIRPRLCWQDDEWQVIGKGSSNCEEKQVVTLKLKCNYNSQQMETTASTYYKNSNFPFSNIQSIQEVCTIASQSKKRNLTNCYTQNVAYAKPSKKIRATGKDKRLNQINPNNNRLTGSYKKITGWQKVDGSVGCSTYDADDSIASSVASCSISKKNVCRIPERFDGNGEYDSDAESCCERRSEKGNSLLPQDEKLTDEIHRVELHAYRTTIVALHASGPLSWEQETLLTNLRDSLHITNDEHLMEIRNLQNSGGELKTGGGKTAAIIKPSFALNLDPMASSSEIPNQEGGAAMMKQRRGPNFMLLLPLIYAPVLPLIRIGLRRNPVLRDRLFTAVLVGAFAHGTYLVYPFLLFTLSHRFHLISL
ncbi:hypothetical protein V2J09_010318 [Rumex salicifolius]